MTDRTLIYVADPMCSWCWGFAPVVAQVRAAYETDATFELVLGGLAPDSDEPMPAATRTYVQAAWDAVEARTGATFNRAYWTECAPRRSTWPACRAVLAAGLQGSRDAMFVAIQAAFYRDARDPSERATLVRLADELGLDVPRFDSDLDSAAMRAALETDMERARRLGVNGLPTLLASNGERTAQIVRGYADRETTQTLLSRFFDG